uniref:Uncharacterized protein, isoform D n=1 Tax=Drosophila pseudoobscura pseudoobscura TaxID=46245 RepID=A0A0R3P1U0_DROPS
MTLSGKHSGGSKPPPIQTYAFLVWAEKTCHKLCVALCPHFLVPLIEDIETLMSPNAFHQKQRASHYEVYKEEEDDDDDDDDDDDRPPDLTSFLPQPGVLAERYWELVVFIQNVPLASRCQRCTR